MLAFVGTAVSTIVIAVFMWVLGVLHLSFRISFFHASLFGAIISATDPVRAAHVPYYHAWLTDGTDLKQQ